MIVRFNHAQARTFGAALAITTLAATIAAGVWVGIELAVLVLAAGALVLVIALLWSSVAGLSGDTPLTLDEALGMGAPSVEEEQKRAVLRALKDLEFERSVGKITEQDYREFSERYRAEARRLIAAVDASLGPSQAQAEKLANERIAAAGLSPEPETKQASTAVEAEPERDAASDAEKPSEHSDGDGDGDGKEKPQRAAETAAQETEP